MSEAVPVNMTDTEWAAAIRIMQTGVPGNYSGQDYRDLMFDIRETIIKRLLQTPAHGTTKPSDPAVNDIFLWEDDSDWKLLVCKTAGTWTEINLGGDGTGNGAPGARGSLWTSGTLAERPQSGNIQDQHLVAEGEGLGDVWQLGESSWQKTGNIRGPQGTGQGGDADIHTDDTIDGDGSESSPFGVADNSIDVDKLFATGTRDKLHFYRADGTFSTLPPDEGLVISATGEQFGIWTTRITETVRRSERVTSTPLKENTQWGVLFISGLTVFYLGGEDVRDKFPINSTISFQVDSGKTYSAIVAIAPGFVRTSTNVNTTVHIQSNPFNLNAGQWLQSGTNLVITDVQVSSQLGPGILLIESGNQLVYSTTDNEGDTKGDIELGLTLIFTADSITPESTPTAHSGEIVNVISVSDVTGGKRLTYDHVSGRRHLLEEDLSTEVALYHVAGIDSDHAGGLEIIDGQALLVSLDKMVLDSGKLNRVPADRGKAVGVSKTDENEAELLDIPEDVSEQVEMNANAIAIQNDTVDLIRSQIEDITDKTSAIEENAVAVWSTASNADGLTAGKIILKDATSSDAVLLGSLDWNSTNAITATATLSDANDPLTSDPGLNFSPIWILPDNVNWSDIRLTITDSEGHIKYRISAQSDLESAPANTTVANIPTTPDFTVRWAPGRINEDGDTARGFPRLVYGDKFIIETKADGHIPQWGGGYKDNSIDIDALAAAVAARLLPTGGTNGQFLGLASGAAAWQNAAAGGSALRAPSVANRGGNRVPISENLPTGTPPGATNKQNITSISGPSLSGFINAANTFDITAGTYLIVWKFKVVQTNGITKFTENERISLAFDIQATQNDFTFQTTSSGYYRTINGQYGEDKDGNFTMTGILYAPTNIDNAHIQIYHYIDTTTPDAFLLSQHFTFYHIG